jgi:hypothetical protein
VIGGPGGGQPSARRLRRLRRPGYTSDVDGAADERHPRQLCDLCGAVIPDGSQIYGVVPDPSAVYETAPEFNGKRLIVACSQDHLRALAELYWEGPDKQPPPA